jgi:ATPase
MQSEDLARPVIVVSSLLDDKDLFEIYTYSDNVVVMPLEGTNTQKVKSPIYEAAEKAIQLRVQGLIKSKCEVEVT